VGRPPVREPVLVLVQHPDGHVEEFVNVVRRREGPGGFWEFERAVHLEMDCSYVIRPPLAAVEHRYVEAQRRLKR
jgi:hypothetical protein